MISENYLFPIVIFGFDKVTEEYTDLVSAISGNAPDLTDQEKLQIDVAKSQYELSDVFLKQLRIPVPIIDAIGMTQIGSTSVINKDVYYDDNKVALANSRNSVTVAIELKSALSRLSTSADLFYAIANKLNRRFTTSPRCSFFSPSMCIFNAYLTGISRAYVADSDKEILNLTFERSENSPERAQAEEITPISETPTLTPEELKDTSGPSSRGVQPKTTSSRTNTNGRLFIWYKIDNFTDIYQRVVTQFQGVDDVNRLPFIVHKSEKEDFSGQLRRFITVEYDKTLIPFGLDGNYPYFQANPAGGPGFAVDQLNDDLYLGIEAT